MSPGKETRALELAALRRNRKNVFLAAIVAVIALAAVTPSASAAIGITGLIAAAVIAYDEHLSRREARVRHGA